MPRARFGYDPHHIDEDSCETFSSLRNTTCREEHYSACSDATLDNFMQTPPTAAFSNGSDDSEPSKTLLPETDSYRAQLIMQLRHVEISLMQVQIMQHLQLQQQALWSQLGSPNTILEGRYWSDEISPNTSELASPIALSYRHNMENLTTCSRTPSFDMSEETVRHLSDAQGELSRSIQASFSNNRDSAVLGCDEQSLTPGNRPAGNCIPPAAFPPREVSDDETAHRWASAGELRSPRSSLTPKAQQTTTICESDASLSTSTPLSGVKSIENSDGATCTSGTNGSKRKREILSSSPKTQAKNQVGAPCLSSPRHQGAVSSLGHTCSGDSDDVTQPSTQNDEITRAYGVHTRDDAIADPDTDVGERSLHATPCKLDDAAPPTAKIAPGSFEGAGYQPVDPEVVGRIQRDADGVLFFTSDQSPIIYQRKGKVLKRSWLHTRRKWARAPLSGAALPLEKPHGGLRPSLTSKTTLKGKWIAMSDGNSVSGGLQPVQQVTSNHDAIFPSEDTPPNDVNCAEPESSKGVSEGNLPLGSNKMSSIQVHAAGDIAQDGDSASGKGGVASTSRNTAPSETERNGYWRSNAASKRDGATSSTFVPPVLPPPPIFFTGPTASASAKYFDLFKRSVLYQP